MKIYIGTYRCRSNHPIINFFCDYKYYKETFLYDLTKARFGDFMPAEEKQEGKEADETIYDGNARSDLVEDDEMSPHEEGFMQGYDEADEHEDGEQALNEEEEL